MEEDALKRLVIFERQNPQGFSRGDQQNYRYRQHPQGVFLLVNFQTWLKEQETIALGQVQKRANSADVLIKQAFDKLSKRLGEFKPKSKTGKIIKDGKAGLSIGDIKNPRNVRCGYKTNSQESRSSQEKKFSQIAN